MILTGVLVNAGAILLGGIAGYFLRRGGYRVALNKTMMQGLGLCVLCGHQWHFGRGAGTGGSAVHCPWRVARGVAGFRSTVKPAGGASCKGYSIQDRPGAALLKVLSMLPCLPAWGQWPS